MSATPEIHHPQQPDGIADDSSDYPDAARAARRVDAWIREWGDGLIDVAGQRPLYARDLAALVRAAKEELPAARADAERYRKSLPATTEDYWHWRKRAEATERELVDRGKALVEWQNVAGQHQRALFEARAEVERLRPVVDAARRLRDAAHDPVWVPDAVDGAVGDVAEAVDTLDADAPAEPDPAPRMDWTEQESRVFNAVTRALAGRGRFASLSDRVAVTKAVLAEMGDGSVEPTRPCAECGHRPDWHRNSRCAGDLLHCECTGYAAPADDGTCGCEAYDCAGECCGAGRCLCTPKPGDPHPRGDGPAPESECPGDPYCRPGHRCPAHKATDGVVDRVLLDATDAPVEPAICGTGVGEPWCPFPTGHDGDCGARNAADHPHTDPGDGRTECQTCGKFVWPAIHSCKGVPVTDAARARFASDGGEPR